MFKYKIENTGQVSELLDSVYFSIWNDPDLGDYGDDLVGCDTLERSGYVYNGSTDNLYGINPPSFFVKQLQGPPIYIPGETFIESVVRKNLFLTFVSLKSNTSRKERQVLENI